MNHILYANKYILSLNVKKSGFESLNLGLKLRISGLNYIFKGYPTTQNLEGGCVDQIRSEAHALLDDEWSAFEWAAYWDPFANNKTFELATLLLALNAVSPPKPQSHL